MLDPHLKIFFGNLEVGIEVAHLLQHHKNLQGIMLSHHQVQRKWKVLMYCIGGKKNEKKRYPVLSCRCIQLHLNQRFLSESGFLGDYRSILTPKMLEGCVCLKDWYKGEFKDYLHTMDLEWWYFHGIWRRSSAQFIFKVKEHRVTSRWTTWIK